MAKFIFIPRTNFITYTASASPAADTDFPITNIYEYNYLPRNYKSASDSTAVHSIVLDTGTTSKTIVGIMIDDCNFSTGIRIQGNNSDSWTTPTYDSTNTISLDYRVNRYKIYKEVSWACRYVRIYMPAQTSTDAGNPRIGRVILATAKVEVGQNPFYPYEYTAAKRYKVNEFESGSEEIVNIGAYKIWQCEFGIDALKKSNENEWWGLDNNDEDQLMVVYENCGTTAHTYVCQKKGELKISEKSYGVVEFSNFILKEKI